MPAPNENLTSYARMTSHIVTTNTNRTVTTTDAVPVNSESLTRLRVTDSVSTPNFYQIKKRWLLPVNPYTKDVRVYSDPGTTWFIHYDDNNGIYKQDRWDYANNKYWLYSTPCLSTADDPTQRAILRLLNSLSDGKTNTLVSAAEAHKTVEMVTKTATTLYKALKALKKGDIRGSTNALGITFDGGKRRRFDKRKPDKYLPVDQKWTSDPFGYRPKNSSDNRLTDYFAETWLGFAYGWRPLLKDVYDHARALAELQIERQNVMRFAKGKAKTSSVKINVPMADAKPHFLSYVSSESKRWCEFGVTYRLQNGELNTFSQLGIDNPMEVAWELVPFSFVVDWFLPVGEYLRSLSATTGLIFEKGYKATRDVTNVKREVYSDGKPWATTDGKLSGWQGGPMVSKLETVYINRQRLISFPTAYLPDFKAPFGTGEDYGLQKALSAIALLQSLFNKKSSLPEWSRK